MKAKVKYKNDLIIDDSYFKNNEEKELFLIIIC
jgi:hypothetical protein